MADVSAAPRPIWPWLALLMLAGLTVRGWDVANRGPLMNDEASYTLTAQTLAQPALWAFSRVTAGSTEDLTTHMRRFMGPFGRQVGFPPGSHIGFYGLVAAAGVPLGFPPYTSLLVSVILGSLTVAMLWFLVQAFHDRSESWVAIVLLAASPYHILYSRLGFTNASAALFLVAGAALIIKSWSASEAAREQRLLTYGGLCLGYAFLVHPSTLPQIGLFFVAEAAQFIYVRQACERKRIAHRLVRLAVTIALPVVAAETAMWAVLIVKNTLLPSVGWNQTYLTALVPKLFGDAVGRGVPEPLFQLRLLNLFEGTVALVIAAVGVVICVRRFEAPVYRLVALQTLVPLAFWSLTALQVARTFVPVLPFWECLVAIGLVGVARAVARMAGARPIPVLAAIAALLLVSRLPVTAQVVTLRSGWSEATAYVSRLGNLPVAASQRSIAQLYLGIPNVIPPPLQPAVEAFADLGDQRPRYVLGDVEEVLYQSVRSLGERCRPVASFGNPALDFWPLLADQIEDHQLRRLALASERRSRIDVFDLESCPGGRAQARSQE